MQWSINTGGINMVELKYKDKESIPAKFADAAEQIEGKEEWVVKVDLASKVDEFRENNIELSKKVESLSKIEESVKTFFPDKEDEEDFDFEALSNELAELRKTSQKVSDGKLKASDDIEKEVDKRVSRLQETHAKELEDLRNQNSVLVLTVEQKEQKIRDNILDTAISNLTNDESLGLNPTATKMIAVEARTIFSVDDKGALLAKDQDGNTLWGDDGRTILTPREWVSNDKLRETHSWMFRQSVGAGDAFDGGENGYTEKQLADMDSSDLWAAAAQESEMRKGKRM
jgi:hypothetical protein